MQEDRRFTEAKGQLQLGMLLIETATGLCIGGSIFIIILTLWLVRF